jgi:hypothetical protein
MRTRAVTRLVSVSVPGPAGDLEGLLHERDAGPHAAAAVVCHPHPLYGGTLHNKVVHRVAGTLHELGAAVLRFNFRGVGRSAGTFDRGPGEVEDARAALAFMRERHPHARRWLAGFSFGSWAMAALAGSERDVDQLILIAPPVGSMSFEGMRETRVPKLVVQGTADEFCPIEDLDREFPTWAPPKVRVAIEGAGHFFDRRLEDLAEAVSRLVTGSTEGRES